MSTPLKSRKKPAKTVAPTTTEATLVPEIAVAVTEVAEIAPAEIAQNETPELAALANAEIVVAVTDEIAPVEIAPAETEVAIVAVTEVAVTEVAIVAETEVVVFDEDVKLHALKIAASWQKAVSSIIETGQYLIEAKRDLGHGRFSKLFDKDVGNLPFGQDTGQRLMKIASHPVFLNPDYSRLLPAAWQTLYALSRAPNEQLEGWIVDGTVHAELQQVEAIALVNGPSPIRHLSLVGLTGSYMAEQYTQLIVQGMLYEGACELPWPEYFAYRDAHPGQYPLTNADLAYVAQWTDAGPKPEPDQSDEAVAEGMAEALDELHQEIEDDKGKAPKQKNVKPPDGQHVTQSVGLITRLDKKLNDNGETDWNKVIEIAGLAMVGDVYDELGKRIETYKLASTVH